MKEFSVIKSRVNPKLLVTSFNIIIHYMTNKVTKAHMLIWTAVQIENKQ